MEFNGDILTVDINMSLAEIKEFEEFIRPRLITSYSIHYTKLYEQMRRLRAPIPARAIAAWWTGRMATTTPTV